MYCVSKTLKQLKHDRRGNVAMVFALTTMALTGVTGMAVDVGRAMSARSSLQVATDAAALAAARGSNVPEADRVAMAAKVFAANLRSDLVGQVTPVIVPDGAKVSVSAQAAISTTLSKLAGVQELTVAASSSATSASGKQLELSMMIDLTGSMGGRVNGQSKIDGLKEAAADLLSIVFPNGATTSDAVRVGIVPFADYVNAGEYASAVTGMPTTGAFANLTNLKSTRNGRFAGNYTGAIMNSPGSQAGATSASSPQAGATFDNAFCAEPTVTTTTQPDTSNIKKWRNTNIGVYLPSDGYNNNPPAGVLRATSSDEYYPVDKVDDHGANYDYDSRRDRGFYIPMYVPASFAQMQIVQKDRNGTARDVGIRVRHDYGATLPPELRRASQAPGGGYWRIKKLEDNQFEYEWETDGWYMPLWGGTSTTTTKSECTTTAQPQGQLITCVTERSGAEAYTDAPPSTSFVGPYNHGNASISNYSEDGKCYVAGRELPKIIPLTNDRTALTDFFTNATVGGATPGHLGTMWSYYMLSPNWSSIWPAASAPTAYNTPNVIKAAVIMTDGEYNIHYTSPAARDQALATCQKMKDSGITVYAVGFGFSSSATASATGSTEQRAKDLLQRCASDSSKYFFPYDGAQLREDFKNIGSQLMGLMESTQPTVTN
ncbi:MAG: pilus assembly protein [Hyphomicrobiaceae bacterium]